MECEREASRMAPKIFPQHLEIWSCHEPRSGRCRRKAEGERNPEFHFEHVTFKLRIGHRVGTSNGKLSVLKSKTETNPENSLSRQNQLSQRNKAELGLFCKTALNQFLTMLPEIISKTPQTRPTHPAFHSTSQLDVQSIP